MQACVLKKISYPCKFGTLSRSEMKRLDSVLDSFYKKITRNMNSHPASLIHMAAEDFGLGLPSCFDLVQLEKWGYICRGLKGSVETVSATHGLLERILASNNIRVGDGVQLYLPYFKEGRKYVASSLVEWNEAQQATLCRGGCKAVGREESVLSCVRQEMLRGLGYCVKGDFVTSAVSSGKEGPKWAIPPAVWKFKEELLDWLGPVPRGAQKVARGQFWQCSNDVTCAARQRIEVVGWDQEAEPSIYYVVWTTAEYKLGKRIRRPAGRAEILISKYRDLFAGVVERVIVGAPMCRNGVVYRHVTATQVDRPPVFRAGMQKAEWMKRYDRWVKVPAQIFVDGSWSEPVRSLRDIITEAVPGVGAAAVVILPNPVDSEGEPNMWWRNVQAIRIIDGAGAGLSSSYGMEFIANAIGCQLSALRDNRSPLLREETRVKVEDSAAGPVRPTVFTDCQSVQKQIRACEARAKKGNATYKILCEDIFRAQQEGVPQTVWTPAHPERRKPSSFEWDYRDWGIYIADRVAAGDMRQLADDNISVKVIAVSAVEAYQGLISQDQWYWGDKEYRPAGVGPTASIAKTGALVKYLGDRDMNRISRGELPYWKEHSLRFAASLSFITTSNLSTRAFMQRNEFDKNMHGGNVAKCLADPVERLAAEVCLLCGGKDSQQHWTSECAHPDMAVARGIVRDGLFDHKLMLQKQPAKEVNLIRIIDIFLAQLRSRHGRRLLMSNWNTELFDVVEAAAGSVEATIVSRRGLAAVCRILEAGGQSMWTLRKETLLKSERYEPDDPVVVVESLTPAQERRRAQNRSATAKLRARIAEVKRAKRRMEHYWVDESGVHDLGVTIEGQRRIADASRAMAARKLRRQYQVPVYQRNKRCPLICDQVEVQVTHRHEPPVLMLPRQKAPVGKKGRKDSDCGSYMVLRRVDSGEASTKTADQKGGENWMAATDAGANRGVPEPEMTAQAVPPGTHGFFSPRRKTVGGRTEGKGVPGRGRVGDADERGRYDSR